MYPQLLALAGLVTSKQMNITRQMINSIYIRIVLAGTSSGSYYEINLSIGVDEALLNQV